LALFNPFKKVLKGGGQVDQPFCENFKEAFKQKHAPDNKDLS